MIAKVDAFSALLKDKQVYFVNLLLESVLIVANFGRLTVYSPVSQQLFNSRGQLDQRLSYRLAECLALRNNEKCQLEPMRNTELTEDGS